MVEVIRRRQAGAPRKNCRADHRTARVHSHIQHETVSSILERLTSPSEDLRLQAVAAEFARLETVIASLNSRLALMAAMNPALDHLAPELGSAEHELLLPTHATFTAGDASRAVTGLYPLEFDEHGKPYRWTGPESFFAFRFLIDRRAPVDFALTFDRQFGVEVVDDLRCYVDGLQISTVLNRGAGSCSLTGMLPIRQFKGGSTLTFVCSNMRSPATEENSQDQRMLGLMFRKLEVNCQANRALGGEGH